MPIDKALRDLMKSLDLETPIRKSPTKRTERSDHPRRRLIYEDSRNEVRERDKVTIDGEEFTIVGIYSTSKQVRIKKNGRGCLISPKSIKAIWI